MVRTKTVPTDSDQMTAWLGLLWWSAQILSSTIEYMKRLKPGDEVDVYLGEGAGTPSMMPDLRAFGA